MEDSLGVCIWRRNGGDFNGQSGEGNGRINGGHFDVNNHGICVCANEEKVIFDRARGAPPILLKLGMDDTLSILAIFLLLLSQLPW